VIGARRGSETLRVYTLSVLVTQRFPSTHGISERSVARRACRSTTMILPLKCALSRRSSIRIWTYSVTPEQCVRNFSDSCDGKQEELRQIEGNRVLRRQLVSTLPSNCSSCRRSTRLASIDEAPPACPSQLS